ncbi:MAG: hypothetical protein ACYDBQ_04120 [Thermoplasmatota archaeon]
MPLPNGNLNRFAPMHVGVDEAHPSTTIHPETGCPCGGRLRFRWCSRVLAVMAGVSLAWGGVACFRHGFAAGEYWATTAVGFGVLALYTRRL